LAQYLAARLGIPDAWALGLLQDNHVTLDSQPATESHIINLSAGPHVIGVTFPEAWPRHMAATKMLLDIIYEDKQLVVLNKPAGRVVHPARGHLDNQTLQNGLRCRYRHLLGQDGVTIGPVHRLDKDTSGVVVFALTTEAYINLSGQFANGVPHKRYIAIADGTADFDWYVCDSAIGPDPLSKGLGKVIAPEDGGKNARTDFTVLEKGSGWTVVQAEPHTGRPHQIRIHAKSLGLPLAGDKDYNPAPERLGIGRQALHAASLTFVHPETGERMTCVAPLADDMAALLRDLGCSLDITRVFREDV
jgi:pseudouridine synthase, RluA family